MHMTAEKDVVARIVPDPVAGSSAEHLALLLSTLPTVYLHMSCFDAGKRAAENEPEPDELPASCFWSLVDMAVLVCVYDAAVSDTREHLPSKICDVQGPRILAS